MNEEMIYFPEEYNRRTLNALYREIPLKDTTFRLLRKYLNAMAALYGIITLKKAYEIIHAQCPRLVTEEEFLAFAEIAKHEIEGYHILGECDIYRDCPKTQPMEYEIIDAVLLDEELEGYFEVQACQAGKPFYVPPKEQLLRYADWFYLEDTPEALALKEFLEKKVKLPEKKRKLTYEMLCAATRQLGNPLEWVMDAFTEIKIHLNERQLEAFMKYFQAFYNNTRMQSNRGYTPKEIRAMTPPEDNIPKAISLGPNMRRMFADGTMDVGEMIGDVLNMKLPSEELRVNILQQLVDIQKETQPGTQAKKAKVGRNEPCPCGSGKKYKHCCGK